MALGERFEDGGGLVKALLTAQRLGAAQFGSMERGMICGYPAVDIYRKIELIHVLEQFAGQQQGIHMGRTKVHGKAGVDQSEVVVLFTGKCRREGVEDFGNTVTSRADMREGQRRSGGQCIAHGLQARVDIGSKGTVQQGRGVGIAPQLAENLGPGHDTATGVFHATCAVAVQQGNSAFEIADRGKRQRLVIDRERSKPLYLGNLIEIDKRAGHVPLAQLRPCAHQTVSERPKAAVLADGGQDVGIAFGMGIPGDLGHEGDLAGKAALGHLVGDGGGGLDLADGDIAENGTLKDLGVGGIALRGAPVMGGRCGIVAEEKRLTTGKVIPGQPVCRARPRSTQRERERQKGCGHACFQPECHLACLPFGFVVAHKPRTHPPPWQLDSADIPVNRATGGPGASPGGRMSLPWRGDIPAPPSREITCWGSSGRHHPEAPST